MSHKKTTSRGNSQKVLLASLTIGAMLAATRPSIPAKVHANGSTYEWVKHADLDLLGGEYSSAASSADGSHLLLGVTDGGENYDDSSVLYMSDDYGNTWENVGDVIDSGAPNNWMSVDVSNNDQTMVAASIGTTDWDSGDWEEYPGKIFISENAGSTWEDVSPVGPDNWQHVVVSGDGSTIVALAEDDEDNAYISTDGGDNWTTSEIQDTWDWESLSISDDGDTILIGGENNSATSKVHLSVDGGDNWDDISPDSGEMVFSTRTAMSSDGSKIAVSTEGYNGSYFDAVYLTENDGTNWTDISPEDPEVNYWQAIALSDNGSVLSVLDDDENMFISMDDGESWSEENPDHIDDGDNTWVAVDMSADGSRMVVANAAHAFTGYNENLNVDESSVADFSNAESGAAVKLTTPDGTTITCYSSVKETVLSVQDAGYQYPLGLVDFCFDTSEESNEVTLTFVTDLKPDQVVARKYNPITETYGAVSGVVITAVTHEGQPALQVTYTIIDNGPLDVDPDVGEIADPVGLASTLGAPNTGVRNVRDMLFIKH